MTDRRFSPTVLAAAWISILAGCGAPEVVLDIRTDPPGASVYLSRQGVKAYKGLMGPVKGDMNAEPVDEEFVLVGNAPVEFASPLEERESGASVLGIGVAVVRRYATGIVRVEKEGFEPLQRNVRFKDGTVTVHLTLHPTQGSPPSPTP